MKTQQKETPSAISMNMRVTVGSLASKPCPEPKTSGVKIRGTGAATKGTTARGPMA